MILDNWLRRFRAGAALCRFDPRSWNRIANVLESIEGVGCRIEKTENGWGWQIIVDGNSDTEPSPGYDTPYEAKKYSKSGTSVTVPAFICYHGGKALEVGETTITITADGDWIALQYDPDTEAATLIRWPAASGLPQDHDGLLVRGILEFDIEGAEGAEKAVPKREGKGNIGMMAEDGT